VAEPAGQHDAEWSTGKSAHFPEEVIAMPKFLVTYHGAGAP
jgi:hypothetical protein